MDQKIHIHWTEAEAAVGKDDPASDWLLKPQEHAESLTPRAGALRRVLETNAIQVIMERYLDRDGEAGRQQKIYRSTRKRMMLLAYLAAGAGLLALSLHLVLGYQSDLQMVMVAAHVVMLVWVIIEAVRVNRLDPRRKWLEARGEAELLRIALFDRVMAAREPYDEQREIPLLPLKLAYFRRYQLDVQLRYLEGRGRQLIRTAGLPGWFTGLCLAVAALAFVLAGASAVNFAYEQGIAVPGFVIGLIHPQMVEQVATWAFFALVVSTIYAILMTHQNVSEDARNGNRYLALYQNLKYLKEHGYEGAQDAAERGDEGSVARFVGLVHERMRAEQNEWVSIQRMVEEDDRVLAPTAARGLTDLFPERFRDGS
jgi:hypothetical protein